MSLLSADDMEREGDAMLVISRKSGEKVRIGEDVAIAILEISGSRVVLGIEAPRDIPVRRLDQRVGSDSDQSPGAEGERRSLEGLEPVTNRAELSAPATDIPARVAPPFEYPTRVTEASDSLSKKAPVVRVRRSRKISLPTDPSAD